MKEKAKLEILAEISASLRHLQYAYNLVDNSANDDNDSDTIMKAILASRRKLYTLEEGLQKHYGLAG
jgi:hypothetical protein